MALEPSCCASATAPSRRAVVDPPSGDESFLGGGSNDTWRIGDVVVRICWRGDMDRLAKEVAVVGSIGDALHYPPVLDHGRMTS